MAQNNSKSITDLDAEIKVLEEIVNDVKIDNEILKLNILKKEILLDKLESDQG